MKLETWRLLKPIARTSQFSNGSNNGLFLGVAEAQALFIIVVYNCMGNENSRRAKANSITEQIVHW